MSTKKIKEILYRLYEGLPQKVRAFVSPLVPVVLFLSRVLFLASQFRLSVYLLQGKEKWSGGSLITLFLGDERGVPYFSDLLYSEEPVKESLGKIFIWRIKARLNSHQPGTDLIFIKMDGLFSQFLSRSLSQQGFIIIPEWVLLILDLSKPLSEVWKLSKNKSLRENLREMKRHDYSYEMTQDPTKFEYFYHQMYLPYVTKRFGKLTVITSFPDMERAFKRGQLLLVKKGDDYISGNIIRTDHDTVFSVSVGIVEGKMEYLKAGALTASYYFTIFWAKERGYKWLDFGHCKSFFKDGVFDYKKRWGMGIKISTRVRAVFGMKICNVHHGVRNFLEKNPFIFINQEKLKGLILVDQNHPLTLEEVQSFFTTYTIPGLDCMVILSHHGFTRQAEEFANSCSPQRLHLMGIKKGCISHSMSPCFSLGKT